MKVKIPKKWARKIQNIIKRFQEPLYQNVTEYENVWMQDQFRKYTHPKDMSICANHRRIYQSIKNRNWQNALYWLEKAYINGVRMNNSMKEYRKK